VDVEIQLQVVLHWFQVVLETYHQELQQLLVEVKEIQRVVLVLQL
jgi:hypothetical protein